MEAIIMVAITSHLLRRLCPNANQNIIDGVAQYFNQYASLFQIDSDLRVCHFFAQAAVESAWFQTLEEYASGAEYEGRSDLGNNNPGDGVRYKGRGIFQVTGKYNYNATGHKLGLDLINHPELLTTPQYAVLSALEYWKDHNLNVYADADNVTAMTLHINGGYNALSDREMCLKNMKVLITEPQDMIGMGDKGDPVKAIQLELIAKGYKLGIPDGQFGPATANAIRNFQSNNKLPVPGVVDKATVELLGK